MNMKIEKIMKFNEKRDAISHDWVNFLENQNILPIFIPNTLKDTKNYLEEMKLDGLIIIGGDGSMQILKKLAKEFNSKKKIINSDESCC